MSGSASKIYHFENDEDAKLRVSLELGRVREEALATPDDDATQGRGTYFGKKAATVFSLGF